MNNMTQTMLLILYFWQKIDINILMQIIDHSQANIRNIFFGDQGTQNRSDLSIH